MISQPSGGRCTFLSCIENLHILRVAFSQGGLGLYQIMPGRGATVNKLNYILHRIRYGLFAHNHMRKIHPKKIRPKSNSSSEQDF